MFFQYCCNHEGVRKNHAIQHKESKILQVISSQCLILQIFPFVFRQKVKMAGSSQHFCTEKNRTGIHDIYTGGHMVRNSCINEHHKLFIDKSEESPIVFSYI